MADQIIFTPRAIRVTGPTKQSLDQAIDVSAYDELDLQLGIIGLEGTAPTVTIEIQTAMSNDSEDGWNQLAAFTSAVSVVNTWEAINAKGLLRYVRWNVSAMGGTAPAATFVLSGMARR